jgi:hypothetical protein
MYPLSELPGKDSLAPCTDDEFAALASGSGLETIRSDIADLRNWDLLDNHQLTKKFLTTTTHRMQLFLETIIDHRLCYVSSPNWIFALQILASFGTSKIKRAYKGRFLV